MKVRFTRPAQADLQRIHTYVSQRDPAAASRLVTQIIDRAWALGDTPYEGRKADEPNARVLITSRLRYFIFYTLRTFAICPVADHEDGSDDRELIRGAGPSAR